MDLRGVTFDHLEPLIQELIPEFGIDEIYDKCSEASPAWVNFGKYTIAKISGDYWDMRSA